MKKHSYRTQCITEVDWSQVQAKLPDQPLVVGIDVAKEDMVAALMIGASREVVALVKWRHPVQTAAFFQHLGGCLGGSRLEVVLEPSGSYSAPLVSRCHEQGYTVFRVSPKRTHDAAEVYDGVPSLHDAKAAMIIARLHLEGASSEWAEAEPERRALRAQVQTLVLYDDAYHRNLNRLEGQLGRYWPELTGYLELNSATLLELLIHFGSAAAVATEAESARQLMQRVSRGRLDDERLEQVLESARTTLGVACLEAERAYVQRLAQETRQAQQASQRAQRALEASGLEQSCIQYQAPTIGKRSAVVLYCVLGAPANYASAASYLKAMGLNLKERSSGKYKGRLMLTKRGASSVRRHLYLAALRLIQRDPLALQWYQRKVQRDGGREKMKAVVALMRKLGRALWHVGQGQAFDSSKLFEV